MPTAPRVTVRRKEMQHLTAASTNEVRPTPYIVPFHPGDLEAEFMMLAEKQGATVPLLIGHRVMGISLFWTGEIAKGRKHLDQAAKPV